MTATRYAYTSRATTLPNACAQLTRRLARALGGSTPTKFCQKKCEHGGQTASLA